MLVGSVFLADPPPSRDLETYTFEDAVEVRVDRDPGVLRCNSLEFLHDVFRNPQQGELSEGSRGGESACPGVKSRQ
jgi:hypothetical protein